MSAPPHPAQDARSPQRQDSASAHDWDEPLAYYAQDDLDVREDASGYDDLRPPNTGALYSQQNRSVPSLGQQRTLPQDPQIDPVPPPPPYDATAVLDQFSALHISNDPVPRAGSAMAYRSPVPSAHDPIPRAGTSMSYRSVQLSPNRALGQSLPGHPAQGLPGHPAQGISYSRPPPGRSPDNGQFNDAASIRSTQSGRSQYYSARGEGSEAAYQHDPQGPNRSSSYSYEEGRYAPPQQGWQGPPQGYMAPPVNPTSYGALYAAASDVLGMGPPPTAAPGAPPMQQSPYPPLGHMQQHFNYAATSQISLASSHSSGYAAAPGPPGPYPPPQQAGYPVGPGGPLMRGSSISSTGSGSSGGTQTASMPPTIPEEPEIVPRPTLQRSGTSASIEPRPQAKKAVDLSAPSYTKQYIDEYRQRIKDDPDPEAHFLYAKYLIDAARKIGADAKDQRAVKKYRDSLIQESLKIVRRLATQGVGYDEAQFFLANCHGTGMLGLQVDHERAYHLYLQAAKQNHAAACYRVAVCNEIGAGTRREPQRAAAFYRKAASLGDTAAMYKLGVIFLRGALGEQPNPRDAVGWLKRAAEQADEENPHALHELALLYENPKSGIVPFDPVYAKELYSRAGHLGYTHSQFKLGQCYEYGALACLVDPKRSIAWYTKAAERGHSEAELALSGWYLTGSDGVLKQSDSEAYLWARRAANKGHAKAEYAVGYYAEVGIGVKQDVEFAKRWYMRAAAQGNRRAMNRLTEMKRSGNKRANMARPTRQDAKEECVIA